MNNETQSKQSASRFACCDFPQAKYAEAAAGLHVRFRLGGESYPPMVSQYESQTVVEFVFLFDGPREALRTTPSAQYGIVYLDENWLP